jgi:hypothetical protein
MSERRPEIVEEQIIMVLQGITGALQGIETQLGLLQQQLRAVQAVLAQGTPQEETPSPTAGTKVPQLVADLQP